MCSWIFSESQTELALEVTSGIREITPHIPWRTSLQEVQLMSLLVSPEPACSHCWENTWKQTNKKSTSSSGTTDLVSKFSKNLEKDPFQNCSQKPHKHSRYWKVKAHNSRAEASGNHQLQYRERQKFSESLWNSGWRIYHRNATF